MYGLRRSAERGRSSLDWLDSRHSFSFADYVDPNFTNFRALRVLNEDWIAPGRGFGPHGHSNMEILTVPLSGTLVHEDSRGYSGVLRPGMVQWMRSGRGIVHSEMNASNEEPLHLMQIWIEPTRRRLEADYQDRSFDFVPGRATLIAAGGESEEALPLAQDARVFYVRLEAGNALSLPIGEERFGWVQWLTGSGRVGKLEVAEGDAVRVSEESELELFSQAGADVLAFDLS